MAAGEVDLLIVDYQTPDALDRLLRSIEVTDDIAVWIGLVEPAAGSRLAAADFFRSTGACGDALSWDDNVGYNRAINELGTLGSARTIGCLNADVTLQPGAVTAMATALANNPDWGVVGPRQVNSEGRVTAGGVFGTPAAPAHRGWLASGGYQDVRDDAVYVSGSALFLRRHVWDELTACPDYQAAVHDRQPGPWLDTQHYYGDTYLSFHATHHGYKAAYVGTTTIRHEVGRKRVKSRDMSDLAHFRNACDLHGIDHE